MKRKEKKTKNPIRKRRTVRIVASAIAAGILLPLFVLMCLSLYVENNLSTEIDEELFFSAAHDSISRLYYFDENGNACELTEEIIYGHEVTIYKSLSEIPDALKDAFVSIEDKRYYSHDGVDWYRTLAAGANYLLKFSGTFGASTITQQLVKNITGSDEITVKRKLQEIFFALDLEKKADKAEIKLPTSVAS